MSSYKIKVINAIAPEGLKLLGDKHTHSPDEDNPHGIVIRSSPLDINQYPELLAVARAGSGVNNIPVEEATKKGICVFNTPGANANAVVELLFTMLGIWQRNIQPAMEFCQSLSELDDEEMNKEMEAKKKQFKGYEMAGKTIAIIGLGKIGVMVANGAVHKGMKVVGFDPFPVIGNIHLLSSQVKLAKSRREALADADFVTVHVPLNKNTKGLVSNEFIDMMKDGSLLFNYARGPVVDNDAVIAALESGKLSGHITDFPARKLFGNDKILFSPHLGASTFESENNCSSMAVKELKDYLEYGNICHSVNFPNIENIPTVDVYCRLIVITDDQPGMIGQVTNILGDEGINITSLSNESNGTIGYNIIDCKDRIDAAVTDKISACAGVIKTRVICFK